MTAKSTPGAKGVMWSSGVHNVFVNKKPAKVYVSKKTIPATFEVLQKEIKNNEGITLGIDHIPDELLKSYPILQKMDILNVGRITEIAHNGEKIYATKSEHTNPLIAELHARGALPAYSIIAPMDSEPCPTGQVDYVLKRIIGIKRADYVDEGGCQDCKTGIVPDDMILTAKLSMEVDKVVEENNQGTEETSNDETNPGNEGAGEGVTENPGETPGGEEETPGTEETEEKNYVTQDYVDKQINSLKELIQNPSDKVQIEARLSNMELEAKKAKYSPIVDKAIREGRVLPVDKDMFVDKGIGMDNEKDFKELMAKRPVIVDLGEHGHQIEAGNGERINLEETCKEIDGIIEPKGGK